MIETLQQIVRFKAIHDRLKQNPAPTLEQIIAKVELRLGKEVGKRTVQLDIQNLRYNQGLGAYAPIKYSRAKKVYQYSDPEYSWFGTLEKNL